MTRNATDVYAQHRASFPQVSAYVILKGGERVATIAFKFPRDGAGRLYAYVHWFGVHMVRGYAGGYGYDKKSAACASAARRMPANLPEGYEDANEDDGSFTAFKAAISQDDGHSWDARLRSLGFTVLQAV
jgi:hypothetical protein